MRPLLASPNRLVWAYASISRTLAHEAFEAGSDDDRKAKAAAAVVMGVAMVETYMNVLARLWLSQVTDFRHSAQIERDLKTKKSLGRKIEEWPELLFGQRAEFGRGAGQRFKETLDVRNRLMHFTSEYHTFEHENIAIRGLMDVSVYEELTPELAEGHVASAYRFVDYMLELQGTPEQRRSHALHHWLGVPPGAA